MREKKRAQASRALNLRLGTLLLLLWLACMAAFTWGIAQYILRELTDAGPGLAENAVRAGRLDSLYEEDDYAAGQRQLPGAAEYRMNRAIAATSASVYAPSLGSYPGMEHTPSIFRSSAGACETAVLFLDTDNQVIRQSGDFVYFSYVTEADWQAAGSGGAEGGSAGEDAGSSGEGSSAGEEPEIAGYGWLDLGDPADERYGLFRTTYAGVHSLYDLRALRLTGYWDGSRLDPLAMAVATESAYYQALEQAAPGWDTGDAAVTGDTGDSAAAGDTGDSSATGDSGGSVQPPYTMAQLDAQGLLEWDLRFDRTDQAEPGQQLVTIYALYPEMDLYEGGGPVRYQESEEYENLLALLGAVGFYRDSGRYMLYQSASQFDMWDLIVFSSYGVYDLTGYDAASGEPYPEPVYMALTALRASPLRIAMGFLRNVYGITFLAMAAGFLLLRRSLGKNLLAPLGEINQGMATGWPHLPGLREKPPRWQELYELYRHYEETQDARQAGKNEQRRLQAALDYARTAEENRRQMTSHIAHELKTPLAVIHSYAEGLQEHIAEEKRDQYLQVILEETERMDAMVLEMLDLSRLEAGRVKLARDVFDLAALARKIFDRLRRAAEAKELQLTLDFPETCPVTADEGRMAQVVENFVSNAIRYTPAGGKVEAKISAEGDKTRFSIANDCAPLSAEALRKVWESFYRADESRTGEGTGLGLAIARSIVELHGGSCHVRNTRDGVEFEFTI